MKNHRFLWLRNRTTNNRKCEKARNIKEKRTIEMFRLDLWQPILRQFWKKRWSRIFGLQLKNNNYSGC